MKSSTKSGEKKKPQSEFAYYRQRYQNRVHSKLVSFIQEEAQRLKITKKEMADRLGKDPGQLSRLLSAPSNLTLDTISDILLVLDAEAEPPQIGRFTEKRAPNYVHPLIARVTQRAAAKKAAEVKSAKPENVIYNLNQIASTSSVKAEIYHMAAE